MCSQHDNSWRQSTIVEAIYNLLETIPYTQCSRIPTKYNIIGTRLRNLVPYTVEEPSLKFQPVRDKVFMDLESCVLASEFRFKFCFEGEIFAHALNPQRRNQEKNKNITAELICDSNSRRVELNLLIQDKEIKNFKIESKIRKQHEGPSTSEHARAAAGYCGSAKETDGSGSRRLCLRDYHQNWRKMIGIMTDRSQESERAT
ncbi:hypothetical protein R3P38DRAFT_3348055 [Favolaschia claudopus]|uniref:Uncharacterized protein n=1 Tax=Favolaschia claudopus TaxID=2862362 RepID=A0AAW0C4Q9_9AGAR